MNTTRDRLAEILALDDEAFVRAMVGELSSATSADELAMMIDADPVLGRQALIRSADLLARTADEGERELAAGRVELEKMASWIAELRDREAAIRGVIEVAPRVIL